MLRVVCFYRLASQRSRRRPEKSTPPGRNMAEPRRAAIPTKTMNATIGNCVARSMFLHATRHGDVGASQAQRGGTSTKSDLDKNNVCYRWRLWRVVCFYRHSVTKKSAPPRRNAAEPRREAISTKTMSAPEYQRSDSDARSVVKG